MAKERESREVQQDRTRSGRVPIHEQKQDILTARVKDAGYEYRFVNDVVHANGARRVDSFKLAGWEVAPSTQVGNGSTDANVSLGSTSEAVVEKSSGRRAVLMRIPKELYEQDQKAKQDKITRQERQFIRRKKKAEDSDDGTYGEVSIGSRVQE